jgi:sugar (pentulose or hexulose) kinase
LAPCAGKGAGLYAHLTDLEGELRKRVATFEPDPAAVAIYADTYPAWQRIYARMLELSEEGLLQPLWRAAGARGLNQPEVTR